MEELEVTVDESSQGKRLDQFLVYIFKDRFSRSFIQKLIREKAVLVNRKAAKAHYKIAKSEKIWIRIPAPKELNARSEDIPLDIIYEDKELIVINKTAGMVVHPAAGNFSGTLVNALLYHCKTLSGIGGVLRPGIVHRLDKNTSGIMVIAKTDQAHRALAKQFKDRSIKKEYIALVKGNIEFDEGQMDMPLGRHPRHRKMRTASFVPGAKGAVTNYKTLERFKEFTLVKLFPLTGRTHQLRVHMAYIGHPILGDKVYGVRDKFDRQMLHAARLGFIHPVTGKFMEFSAELPADMQEIIKSRKGNI